MSAHNIPFQSKKENHTKLSQICSQGIFFLGTEERVRNSRGKRAISVRATEVLLYCRKGEKLLLGNFFSYTQYFVT